MIYIGEMTTHEEYKVPAGAAEIEFTEKRSRFIANLVPAETEEAALAHIAEIRKRHWDATHNVYAYVIRNGPVRFSDDGEPQGTSGMPTLGVFQKAGIFNVCCVVTRYYGGILLGAGGLVRAYSSSARLALDAAGIATMRRWQQVLVPCPYPLFEQLKNLVSAEGGVIVSSEYGVDILMEILVPLENTDSLFVKIADLGSGKIEAERMDTFFRAAKTD